MRFTTPRHALVVGALTVALGIAAPTVALGEEGTPDVLDDSQITSVVTPNDDNLSQPDDTQISGTTTDGTDASTPAGDDAVVPTTVDEGQAVDSADDDIANDQTAASDDAQVLEENAPATLTAASDPDELPVAEGTYTISSSKKSTAVLDVAGGTSKSGANVQIYTSNGTDAQKWDLKHVADGFYSILKHGTNLALDVAGASTKNGANVQLYTSNNTAAQLWKFVAAESGYYNIVSCLLPTLVLDIAGGSTANGANVQVYTGNGTAAQLFKLTEVIEADPSNVELANGTYSIKSASNKNYSLDVAGGSKASGANVQLYTSNDTQAQRYHFESDGNGYYVITVIGSGKALASASGNASTVVNVLQKDYNGDGTQKWSIQKNSNGSFTVINKATRLALDIAGAKLANASNIQTYANNGTAAQKFNIEKANALKDGIYAIASVKAPSSVLETKNGSTASGTAIQLNAANNEMYQRFEVTLVSSGDEEIYRIRTGASGGLLTWLNDGSTKNVVQKGDSETSMTGTNSWALVWNGTYFSMKNTGTGKVLDLMSGSTANGTLLQVYAPNGTPAQHFYFNPANLLPNGTYVINSAIVGKNLAIDVESASTSNGANIQVFTKNGNVAQRFTLTATSASSDTYVIKNVNSGKALSVLGASKESTANVIQNSYSGSASQQWMAKLGDDGCVEFINVNSGLALAIKGGNSAEARANVRQYEVTHNPAQQWKLTPIGWRVSGGSYDYFDANGKKSTFNASCYDTWNRIKNKTSNTQYLIGIDRDRCWANIYQKVAGEWAPLKSWRCAVGSKGSPTPVGEWLTSGRRGTTHVDVEYTAKWVIEVKSPWAFNIHSTPFKPDGRVLTARLGAWITGGCCRLAVDNAHWVYSNIRGGTRVVTY